MAIQHTDKWFVDRDHLSNVVIQSTEGGEIAICSDLTTDDEANAQLICDAVNNTAGKGIDPNAVPGLLSAIKKLHTVAHCICGIDAIKSIINNPGYGGATLLEALNEAKKAIKLAGIKQS